MKKNLTKLFLIVGVLGVYSASMYTMATTTSQPSMMQVPAHSEEDVQKQIRETLESGQQVKLSGFGNFDLRQKSERPGRNPKTGEDIPISARKVVTFRPGQKLKSRVEDGNG